MWELDARSVFVAEDPKTQRLLRSKPEDLPGMTLVLSTVRIEKQTEVNTFDKGINDTKMKIKLEYGNASNT